MPEDRKSTLNYIKCAVCGCPYRDDDGRDIHPPECSRHNYRPITTAKPPAAFPTISQAAADGLREIIGPPGDGPKTLQEFARESASLGGPEPEPTAKRLADYSSLAAAIPMRHSITAERITFWRTPGEIGTALREFESGLAALVRSIVSAEVAHATADLTQQVAELTDERSGLLGEIGRLGARLEMAREQINREVERSMDQSTTAWRPN